VAESEDDKPTATSPVSAGPDGAGEGGDAPKPTDEEVAAEGARVEKAAKKDLRDKAVRAAGWTIAAGLLARVLGVLGSLGITYYLDPEAIGDVQLAVILCFTANQFTLLGYGQYLVAKPDEGPETVFHVTVLHLGLGVVAFASILALGIPLSWWFHAPSLMKYLPWMVVAVIFERLYFVPERVLIRELDFRRVAVARSMSELTYSLSSVLLAVAGFGGMAILLGNIARGIVRLFITWRFVPRAAWLTPTKLKMETYRRILRFGLPLGLSQALAFANTRFDNLLMKRLFGSDVMGRYTLAYNLADVPAEQIGEQIAEVLLPSFARMSPEDRKKAIVRVTGIIALIIFPVAVGFGAVALTAERLMTAKWRGIGAMLMVLCVMSITRPLCSKAHSYLQATDRTIRITQLEGFKLVAVIGCIYGFSRFGPLWSCFGVGLAFLMELSAAWFVMSRGDGIPFTAFFARLFPPLLACVPMVVTVELTRRAMVDLPVLLSLATQMLVGAISYGVGALLLARSQANEFLSLTRSALERRREKKAA
jgi:PST family polysaccharide transporter